VTVAATQSRSELEQRIERIDELIQELETGSDPVLRATAQELVQAVMDLHGSGIERIVALVRQSGSAGQAIMDQFAGDQLVRSLLLLYDLHPQDLETRVLEALEKTRPYLRSHGGNVELVSVDDRSQVRLRLLGSCHGCPSSSLTLKMAVEQAIREAAPEIITIVVDAEGSAEAHPAPLSSMPGHEESTRQTRSPLPLVELTMGGGSRTRSAAGTA
jgi:Fe-S cluster biogenesis protein NfuA